MVVEGKAIDECQPEPMRQSYEALDGQVEKWRAEALRLRQQLAAAEEHQQDLWADIRELRAQVRGSRRRANATIARAAAEGDRAAGLEVELQHCKAKREQAETAKGLFAISEEQFQSEFRRAEAAEAALECCEARLTEARAVYEEARALRRVAEAAQDVPGQCNAVLFLRNAVRYAHTSGEHKMANWIAGIASALAAWDAARGKGGREDEQETL